MTSELLLNRAIPLEAIDALREDIDTAIGAGKCGGLAIRKGVYSLIFNDRVSTDDQNTALQLALNFATTKRTASQIEEAQKQADLDAALETLKDVDAKRPLTQEQTSALLKAVLHMASKQ